MREGGARPVYIEPTQRPRHLVLLLLLVLLVFALVLCLPEPPLPPDPLIVRESLEEPAEEPEDRA